MRQIKNKYLDNFISLCQERYSVDTKDMTMGAWICENTTLGGRKFSFDRYPFQEEIANDMHERVAVIKCSQIGLTEIQIRKTLGFLYRNPHTQGLYSLPDKNLRDVNSKTRISPILEKDGIFNRSGKKPIRSVGMYEVDRSFLHVLNASESAATSISLDLLMIDEVDLTDEAVLALYSSRLQNSDNAIRHDFSTPSFDDFGIDVSYQNSDQREYLCKCEHCNHWQSPDWDLKFLCIPGLSEHLALEEITRDIIPHLDLENAFIKCENCHRPLNLGGQREWVALKPGMSQISHGYKVRPFSTNRLGIKYILQQMLDYQKRDYLRGFYNTVLGKTYRDVKTRLTEPLIKQNLKNPEIIEPEVGAKYAIGIDVGALCHVVIGKINSSEDIEIVKMDVVASGNLEDYVTDAMKKYNIVTGAIDKLPYTPTAQAIFVSSDKKIFPVEYSMSDNYKLRENPDMPSEAYFTVNRTWILDKVAKMVRENKLPTNGYQQHEGSFVSHLQNMVRDEKPETPAVWRKLNREDHFFHTCAYLIVSIYFRDFLVGYRKSGDNRSFCGTMIANVQMGSDMISHRQKYGGAGSNSGHITTSKIIG
jgi:hypothetical protein